MHVQVVASLHLQVHISAYLYLQVQIAKILHMQVQHDDYLHLQQVYIAPPFFIQQNNAQVPFTFNKGSLPKKSLIW